MPSLSALTQPPRERRLKTTTTTIRSKGSQLGSASHPVREKEEAAEFSFSFFFVLGPLTICAAHSEGGRGLRGREGRGKEGAWAGVRRWVEGGGVADVVDGGGERVGWEFLGGLGEGKSENRGTEGGVRQLVAVVVEARLAVADSLCEGGREKEKKRGGVRLRPPDLTNPF
ncbi:hypothetical protein Droror1_Dr00008452 [Drosera rotundifolia]